MNPSKWEEIETKMKVEVIKYERIFLFETQIEIVISGIENFCLRCNYRASYKGMNHSARSISNICVYFEGFKGMEGHEGEIKFYIWKCDRSKCSMSFKKKEIEIPLSHHYCQELKRIN